MVENVICYSGHKYAERPVAFCWDGQQLEVECILSQACSPDGTSFRVRTSEDHEFELRYSESQVKWQIIPLG